MNYSKRIQKLRILMQEVGLDSILITHIKNISYLSGFTGSTALMLVTDKKAYFFTDCRYLEQAENECKSVELVEMKGKTYSEVREVLDEIKPVRLGFENTLNYGLFKNFSTIFPYELYPAGALVEKIRRIKDSDELVLMRKAMEIAESSLTEVLPMIKPGVREMDISLELEYKMRKQGATDRSFDFIVASGPRSSMPHGVASDRIIQDKELITIDFGCMYQGYCSDMTRTFAVGKISEEMKTVYNTVLEAQLKAIESIETLKFCGDVDKSARKVIELKGYGDYFGHGLGHSIGMDVHESPSFSSACAEPFEDGMVFSVEPGIYLPGKFGVRIEDLVLIENHKPVNFNKFDKKLITLG